MLLLTSQPFDSSPRASSSSFLEYTATPSPSRCRRPSTLSSRTSRSSSRATLGRIVALKSMSRTSQELKHTIVLSKFTIIIGAKEFVSYLWLIDRTNLTFGQISVDFEHQKIPLLIFPISFYIHWGDKSEIFLQTERFSKIGKFFNWSWLFSCFWKSMKNFDKKFLKYLYS